MRRNSMGQVLKMGAIVGGLAGTLATILAIGLVWLADTKAGTDNAARLAGPIALVCLGGSTISTMLIYAVRYARVEMGQVLQQNQVIGADEWGLIEEMPPLEAEGAQIYPSPPLPESPDTTLGDQIAQCAYRQAEWRYAFNREPTRAAFERDGTSQPVWNSGRDILKKIGMVTDTGGWAALAWADVEVLLGRIYVDPDRIWVPHNRGLAPMRYSPQLVNNRHTAPPQEAV